MRTRTLVLASFAVIGLLTSCGSYPAGVPLGLTEAEIAGLPAAQQAAVRAAYAQLPAKPAPRRGVQEFHAGKEIVDASRSATLPAIAKPEPPDGESRYRDTSPGAVK